MESTSSKATVGHRQDRPVRASATLGVGGSDLSLIAVVSLYVTATANWTFFRGLLAAFPVQPHNLVFLLSVPVVSAGLLIVLIALLGNRYTLRPLLILLVIATAVIAHFMDEFGVIIDREMVRNVAETDPREVADLLTWGLLSRTLLFGVVPAWLIWRWPLPAPPSLGTSLRNRSLVLVGTATVMAGLIWLSYGHFAALGREHRTLRYYANPTYPIYSAARFIADRARTPAGPLHPLGLDAQVLPTDPHTDLVVMVVGETARADRFALNGYWRDTNPELSRIPNVFSYRNVTACGTSTAISVPCMFALASRQDYDPQQARSTEDALDVLARAGVNVLWRDNNSGSKGVAERVDYQDFTTPAMNPVCDPECRDVGMLAGLQEYIDEHPGDILIVLHQMGNHGPAYYLRYPNSWEHFRPVCHTGDLSTCSDAEIENAYDNAIRYTDHFLAQVVALLQANSDRYETTMMYVSDHGESLGENGLYLHGMPWRLAPAEQVHVPMLLWLGPTSDVDPVTVRERLAMPTTHDSVFHSLLTLFEVESDLLDESQVPFRLLPEDSHG